MFDKIIAFFAPHECLGCAQEDTLLCTGCITALPAARGCCYHCQRVQSSYAPCAACSKVSPLASVWATTNYEHLAKTLVWHMKFERARAATTTIASALLAPPISKQTVIVPIPTATTRMRQRGYDHAKLIARHFGGEAELYQQRRQFAQAASPGLELVSRIGRHIRGVLDS